jgi:hypothetical protein
MGTGSVLDRPNRAGLSYLYLNLRFCGALRSQKISELGV